MTLELRGEAGAVDAVVAALSVPYLAEAGAL